MAIVFGVGSFYLLRVSEPAAGDTPTDDHALAWKRRARSRWTIAACLAVVTFVLLLLAIRLGTAPAKTNAATGSGHHSEAAPSEIWIAVSALGTLAAGVGAIVSGAAAVLAFRTAAAAQAGSATPPAKRRNR